MRIIRKLVYLSIWYVYRFVSYRLVWCSSIYIVNTDFMSMGPCVVYISCMKIYIESNEKCCRVAKIWIKQMVILIIGSQCSQIRTNFRYYCCFTFVCFIFRICFGFIIIVMPMFDGTGYRAPSATQRS